MILKLELLVVASLISCAVAGWKCSNSDWIKYKDEFNKTYDLAEVDLYHYNNYCAALIIIDQQNHDYDTGESNHKLEVNKFTDLSPDEVQDYYNKRGIQRKRRPRPTKKVDYEDEE